VHHLSGWHPTCQTRLSQCVSLNLLRCCPSTRWRPTGFRARANTVHHIHCTHRKTDRAARNALSQIRWRHSAIHLTHRSCWFEPRSLSTLYVRPSILVLGKWSTAEPEEVRGGLFRTKQRLQRLTLPANVTVAGSSVTVNGVLKILVVTLDSTLTFDDGPCYVVRSCNYYLLDLRHLRPCLSLDVAKTMPASIVGSRL